MLNLHFAPSADLLVPKLLGKLRLVWKDPLRPPTVIVPSPALGKWLQLRLADCPDLGTNGNSLALGCVANLEMQTLERFLWNVLLPAANMQRLDVAIIQQVICALLDDNKLQTAGYDSVRTYLKKSDGTTDPVKRVQLASRIARQFQEYEFNRPSVWNERNNKWGVDGLDAKWIRNISSFGNAAEHEAWQKDLYCSTIENLNRIGPPDTTRLLSLPHLHRLRREKGLENGSTWTAPAGSIFLFGVSKVSHFHRNMLVEISQMPGVDMHVFLTNPCAEFWEDVDTWRSHRYPRTWKHDSSPDKIGVPSRNPDDYAKSDVAEFAHFQSAPDSLPKDPPLLELWGRAGKEDIYLWCPQAEWNFEYYCPAYAQEDEPPKTLLAAVQLSLLRRESKLPGRAAGLAWKSDGSLLVLACPDPAREVEELREQILDLVEKGRVRSLNEIVAYIPDPGAYVSQIHRVFGAFAPKDPGYIPYSILGAPGSDSVFAQGVRTLLEIIEGRFDRAHFFALARNPLVQTTRKISPHEEAVWETWAEELGIFRGYNKEHRLQMGDLGQAVTDAHTFELGIARLCIGDLAAGPVAMMYRLLPEPADSATIALPPYRDFETSDADSVEKFCSLAEDLYKDVTRLAASLDKETPGASVDRLIEMVSGWLGATMDETTRTMAAEARVRLGFLEALPVIKQQDTVRHRNNRLGPSEFLALVRECLPHELPEGSGAWTGGMTFAPLRPGMIVPHKVIFALGLDATAFPGTSEKPGWDLLSQKRIVGDSDQVRDKRFAFLELLHAARECLILSFRARTMQKEEELQPSSVILELESYLKSQGLKSGPERCVIRREIPWIVRESLEEIRATGRALGTWDPAQSGLWCIEHEPGLRKAHYRYGTTLGIPWNTSLPPAPPLRTTMYDLRRFFANPLEYHLSKTLGIQLDEQPATMGATDEPLQSSPLDLCRLQKAIWTELLRRVFPGNKVDQCDNAESLGNEAEEAALKIHCEYLVQAGSPEAQVSGMEQRFLLNWARDCAKESLKLLLTFPNHELVKNAGLSLKRNGAPDDFKIALGENLTCSVECRHWLALAPRDRSGSVAILDLEKEGDAKENPDLWLPGALQWLAEHDLPPARRLQVHLVQLNRGDNNGTPVSHDVSPLKPGDYRAIAAWLVRQLTDMLINRCADHLPFAVIKDLTKQNKKNPLTMDQRWARVTGATIDEKLSDEAHGPYTCYLEAFKLAEPRIPQSDEPDQATRDRGLCDLAKRRFAPMLEGWIHE